SEPAAAWAGPSPATASGSEDAAAAPGAAPSSAGPQRAPGRIAAEPEKARGDFHQALAAEGKAKGGRMATGAGRGGRSAAFQTYFAANAGRSLFPGAETSGSVSPQLKSEDS
ncbi:MAG: P-type conjugative transfer protein TrbL, partial [Caulobacteraceae bacterium]|nr:P-type conjugative transfer protein TrbL [Caulobacteraceae bacterium]